MDRKSEIVGQISKSPISKYPEPVLDTEEPHLEWGSVQRVFFLDTFVLRPNLWPSTATASGPAHHPCPSQSGGHRKNSGKKKKNRKKKRREKGRMRKCRWLPLWKEPHIYHSESTEERTTKLVQRLCRLNTAKRLTSRRRPACRMEDPCWLKPCLLIWSIAFTSVSCYHVEYLESREYEPKSYQRACISWYMNLVHELLNIWKQDHQEDTQLGERQDTMDVRCRRNTQKQADPHNHLVQTQ